VIYVQDRADNVSAAAGGSQTVTVECLDKRGKVLVRNPQTWPFGYPDGEQLDPHVHQSVDERVAALVTRCRLKGTKPLLEGEIGGPTVR
jgi:hypothetical protein